MPIILIILKDRTQLTDCCVNGKSTAQSDLIQTGWRLVRRSVPCNGHTRTNTLARVPDRWHEPHTCRNQCGCCSNDSFHQASCQCSWTHHCAACSTDAGLNQHFRADGIMLFQEADSSMSWLLSIIKSFLWFIILVPCSNTVVGDFTRKHINLCTALKSLEPFKENSL